MQSGNVTSEMALRFNKVTGAIEDYAKNFGSDLIIPKEVDVIAVKIIVREAFKIVKVSLGRDSSAAISRDGRVFTWGWNDYGVLGDGTNNSKIIPTEIIINN
jgi:alpha-tubulin suppressor-like RCC1 family protein